MDPSISVLGKFWEEKVQTVWLISMELTRKSSFQFAFGVCIDSRGYLVTSVNSLKTPTPDHVIDTTSITGRTGISKEYTDLEYFFQDGDLLFLKVKNQDISYPYSEVSDVRVGMDSSLLCIGACGEEIFTGMDCYLSRSAGTIRGLVEDNCQLPGLFPTPDINDERVYLPIHGADFDEVDFEWDGKTCNGYATGSALFDRLSRKLVGVIAMGRSQLCLAIPIFTESLKSFEDHLQLYGTAWKLKIMDGKEMVDSQGSSISMKMADGPSHILPDTWKNMVASVWILRVKLADQKDVPKVKKVRKRPKLDNGRLEYLYASGVCISGDGSILTSSQLSFENCHAIAHLPHAIEGRLFSDEEYRPLEVIQVYGGWAVLSPMEKSSGESFVKSSMSRKNVRSSGEVTTIGHPLSLSFSLFKGRITHSCKFDPGRLDRRRDLRSATYYHKRSLTVFDVMDNCSTLNLDDSIGLDLKMRKNLRCPVVPIQGFAHRNGLSGSPLFNNEGSLLGIIWFGDDAQIYGIPSKQIVRDLNPELKVAVSRRRDR